MSLPGSVVSTTALTSCCSFKTKGETAQQRRLLIVLELQSKRPIFVHLRLLFALWCFVFLFVLIALLSQCALQLAMVPAEDAILAKCKSIGIAGSAAELSELDINLLTLFGRYCSASSEKAGVGFCEAVAGACFAVSNRELLGQPGIDAVISAMKSHKSSVKVQSSGCRALWNLTCCNEGNKRLSVAAGAVHCIKAAWNAVAGHTDAVYNAIGALALVTTAESVEAILFPGCLNGILSFMEVHQANSDVQFVCSMAISSFAGYPVGRAALKADDRTSYYLQRARVTHKTHATVQQYSKSALELLGLL